LYEQVMVGDVLHEVDGRNVFRAKVELISQLVPGEDGTAVQLGLRRGGRYAGGDVVRVDLIRRRFAAGPPAGAAGLRLSTGFKSYGSVETQTPPATPEYRDEGCGGDTGRPRRRVAWLDPPAAERVYSPEPGEAADASAAEARPVYVTVTSS
jgi:hypothetical protein